MSAGILGIGVVRFLLPRGRTQKQRSNRPLPRERESEVLRHVIVEAEFVGLTSLTRRSIGARSSSSCALLPSMCGNALSSCSCAARRTLVSRYARSSRDCSSIFLCASSILVYSFPFPLPFFLFRALIFFHSFSSFFTITFEWDPRVFEEGEFVGMVLDRPFWRGRFLEFNSSRDGFWRVVGGGVSSRGGMCLSSVWMFTCACFA